MTKPTAIKALSGAYKKNPDRKPKAEPQPRMGIGAAPKWMTGFQSNIWDEFVDQIAPGVLKNMDRIFLEQGVLLLEKSRLDEINSADRSALLTVLGKLGMNPCDRQKITVEQPKTANDWDGI